MYIINTKTTPVGRPYSVGFLFSLGRQILNCKLTTVLYAISLNAKKNISRKNWPVNRQSLAVAVIVLLDRYIGLASRVLALAIAVPAGSSLTILF